jgi:hypothetical protein
LAEEESKMVARTPSTFRLIGAVGVTGVGVLAAAFGAGNAQTVANLEADHAARLAACGRISDIPRRTGCEAEEFMRHDQARTVVEKQKAAAARDSADKDRKATAALKGKADEDREATAAIEIRTQCLTDITRALKADPPRTTVEAVRAARAAAPNDPCAWATQLGVRSQRHGALSKQ